jgi:hypothetical protein
MKTKFGFQIKYPVRAENQRILDAHGRVICYVASNFAVNVNEVVKSLNALKA